MTPLRIGRTCTAISAPPTAPVQTGSPGRQADATGHDVPSPNTIATPPSMSSTSTSWRSLAQQDHAVALEADELGVAHLARDAALALVEEVVDRRRDRRQAPRGLALRRRRLEPARELLGDEARGQPPLAPARVLHQGGQERNVVADALDREGVERARLRVDRLLARRRMRHQLGDHRIVKDRDLAAFGRRRCRCGRPRPRPRLPAAGDR